MQKFKIKSKWNKCNEKVEKFYFAVLLKEEMEANIVHNSLSHFSQ